MQIFNFGYLSFGHNICVSSDVRIRGYYPKPKRVRELKGRKIMLWAISRISLK